MERGLTITLLTTDRLTSRMFVEYYAAVHTQGKRPLTVSPSLYNSVDVAVSQITKAREALGTSHDLIVLYGVPDQFDASKCPQEVLACSDLVFMADPKRLGDNCKVVKAEPLNLSMEIVGRFSANLTRMANLPPR